MKTTASSDKPSRILLIFLSISVLALSFLYADARKKQHANAGENKLLLDSIGKASFDNYYLTEMSETMLREHDVPLGDHPLTVYQVGKQKGDSLDLLSELRSHDNTIVFRLTELGCHACADSSLSILKTYTQMPEKYNVLVLVDFKNYEDYIKWKKISEINYKVLWLDSGRLPFKIEKSSTSYFFTIDRSLKANNFFAPNSRYTHYIRSYYNGLL